VAVYIIRLYADSLVRLNQKPYLEEGAARSLALNLPGVTVAVFDRFVSVGDVEVPRGLIVQVGLEASDIDEAVAKAKGIASYLLSMLCCVTLASVEQPKPIWVYDASPGAEDRDYRHFAYENECAVLSTRRLEDANLFALLERNFNSFLSDVAIREDWKERVQRAIQSFRAGSRTMMTCLQNSSSPGVQWRVSTAYTGKSCLLPSHGTSWTGCGMCLTAWQGRPVRDSEGPSGWPCPRQHQPGRRDRTAEASLELIDRLLCS